MGLLQDSITKLKSFMTDGNHYEALNYMKSMYVRMDRREGTVLGLEFIRSCLREFVKCPNNDSLQLDILKFFWKIFSRKKTNSDKKTVIEYSCYILDECTTLEPKAEWIDFFNTVICEMNLFSPESTNKFRSYLFDHFIKFECYIEARKHCVFLTESHKISKFLLFYADRYFDKLDYGMLISQATLSVLRIKPVVFAEEVYNNFVLDYTIKFDIPYNYPLEGVFFNFTYLLLFFIRREDVSLIRFIYSKYLPYLQKRDPYYEKLLKKAIVTIFPNYFDERTSNNASSNSLLGSAINFLEQLSNSSNQNNSASSSNPTGSNPTSSNATGSNPARSNATGSNPTRPNTSNSNIINDIDID